MSVICTVYIHTPGGTVLIFVFINISCNYIQLRHNIEKLLALLDLWVYIYIYWLVYLWMTVAQMAISQVLKSLLRTSEIKITSVTA